MKTNDQKTDTSAEAPKHTPGPWKIENVQVWKSRGDPAQVRIIGSTDNNVGGELVADINLGWGNHEANARLIAAAPDLLAACKECQGWSLPCGLAVMIRAAIARTEGDAK